MHLINYEVNLTLTCCENSVIVYTKVANQGTTFAITEAKLYVSVVALSAQYNAKLISGFKRIINWHKYLSKPKSIAQIPNLNHLVESSFKGVNRLFLAFEDDPQRISNKRYYLPNVGIRDYNVMIDEKPVKNNRIIY